MSSLSIALAFLRVRKLFASLFLWPLLIGLGIAFFQISVSVMFLSALEETADEYMERATKDNKEDQVLRSILLGSTINTDSPRICTEQDTCAVNPLDLSLSVTESANLDIEKYSSFFSSLVNTIHVGHTCKTDLCVEVHDEKEAISHVSTLSALGIYHLAQAKKQKEVKRHEYSARQEIEASEELVGDIFLFPRNSYRPIKITDSEKTFVFVMNIALIMLITIWLTLKAHKKILHYFSANGALLPLVAACGKQAFYRALWYLTFFRVLCFLLASVPASLAFILFGTREIYLVDIVEEPLCFVLWVIALLATITLAALIGSLMELKVRHSAFSFLYTFLPLSFAFFGTLLWLGTLFITGTISVILQHVIISLPIAGVSPIILYPLVKMNPIFLVIHASLCLVCILILFKKNTDWFSAHLGEF